jgi:hypothetical protein
MRCGIAFITALCGLAAAILATGWAETDRQGGLTFSPSEFALYLQPEPRVPQTVVFHAVNDTDRNLRVVNISYGCGENCTLGVHRECPFDIPPHSATDIECVITPARTGPLGGLFRVFVDDSGLKEYLLRVRYGM